MNNKYVPTIGIEVHVEVLTKTKIFSRSLNHYEDSVNKNINEIDLGYPGVLPRVNNEVIHKALLATLALNCSINKKMYFDRKNYYYPDLPKGYQITQSRTPIGYDGFLNITIEDEEKSIGIEEMHIEEDTCKSIHINSKTLLNYNRSGIPLIEIVSKPVIKSSIEAMKYLDSLKELLLYLGVSDCKIEEGSMRADVNVSISKDDTLGTKCEIKNIGSISNVGLAIEQEIKRQTKILESGKKLEQETRRFDSKTNDTILMRKKEVGNEYRYIPEPDIPNIIIDDFYITEVKKELKMLPNERRNIYKEKGISNINIDKLINNKDLSDFLNKFINEDIDFKIASNILLGDISFYLNKNKININNTFLERKFVDLVNKLANNSISSKIFKDVLNDIMEKNITLEEIFSNAGISLVNNEEELITIIEKILENNKDSVESYKNGKDNVFKYLMGMIMKETKGNANPVIVNKLLKDLLSKNVN